MICTLLMQRQAYDDQPAFLDALKQMSDREDHVWRGVYDDRRFDRHVRAYIRKLLKMAKDYAGFDRTGRYQ